LEHQTSRAWIGTSGWVYQDWRGRFYPADLRQNRWFEYYARHFDTVEVNNTFYRLPGEAVFDAWARQAPPGFLYAVKANRYLTHIRRLIDPADPLERFLSRARRLGPSLGPVLYQLPPRWRPNLPRLAEFTELLPPNLVNVFEFRDPTWFTPDVYGILRGHQASFCIFDMPGLNCPMEVTAPAIYVRFHGSGVPYGGSYDDAVLAAWAKRVSTWVQGGHDVYVYFNNDGMAAAVQNANTLKQMVGYPRTSPQ
jgi:uncharacterized protein YecE (DUF72 family)